MAALRDDERVRSVRAPSCPLCGSPGSLLYSGLRDRLWDAPGVWSFRECSECRHLWLDPRPIREDIGRLYGSYYTHGAARPQPFAGDDLRARCRRGVMEALGYAGIARGTSERLLGRLARLVPPVWEECEEVPRSIRGPPRGKLLDIGCGDGHYLETMHALGWHVEGLEPDSVAVRTARGRGFDVIAGPIEDAVLPADTFDVITMNHVIEHVVDPARVLEIARRSLRPGGTLLVVTPNVESWGRLRFGISWFHLDPPRHLHIFSVPNLRKCAEGAGLEVRRWRTTGRGPLTYDASVSIRDTGGFRGHDASSRATAADWWFRIAEQALTRVRPEGGEFILLLCTKSRSVVGTS